MWKGYSATLGIVLINSHWSHLSLSDEKKHVSIYIFSVMAVEYVLEGL